MVNAAPVNIQRIDSRRGDAGTALAKLRAALSPQGNIVSEEGRRRTIDIFGEPLSPQQVVERICGDVQARGLQALLDYSARIDKAKLTADSLRVPASELAAAHAQASAEFLATIDRIRQRILKFQQAVVAQDVQLADGQGGFLAQVYRPLDRVGICVPGGAAAYPSTVLMTAVPAIAAGVRELVVIAPPTKFGAYNPDLLATCHALGIDEVYRMGGAQGVAALAYGVDGVRRVDKIVGPGNLFVALAKKHVYGTVEIDSIAGPSEIVILADDSARPEFAAADMIAQAEHAPGASILITWSEALADAVASEFSRQLALLDRGELARQSLEQFGAIVLVANQVEAVALANEIAPEHLHIATDRPHDLLPGIRHAGAVFLGHYSPVALGDYAAGPSHVLPTGGTARFSSGLSARDFQRSMSVISATRAGLAELADDIRRMAEKEGLTAHRASIDVRLRK